MKRRNQTIGVAGLALESTAVVIYCAAFALARIGVDKISLPLPNHFVQALLVFLIVGFGLACVGIFADSKRRSSILALALFLPALIVIGVLDGHF